MSHRAPLALVSPPTRERILDGAAEAVARHGLAKLGMRDVSSLSGVSRPTLYRYFPHRDALLTELARREGLRFRERMLRAIEEAPPGPERILVALEHATRHVREHPVLQRLLETDPDLLLRGLRRYFPLVKADLRSMLGPLLQETHLVRQGVVSADELTDWMLRLMVSAFLLPPVGVDEMARDLTAVYRILVAPPRERRAGAGRPRGRRKPSARRR